MAVRYTYLLCVTSDDLDEGSDMDLSVHAVCFSRVAALQEAEGLQKRTNMDVYVLRVESKRRGTLLG